jgi:hypothetical protein
MPAVSVSRAIDSSSPNLWRVAQPRGVPCKAPGAPRVAATFVSRSYNRPESNWSQFDNARPCL